jgi:hypothetical protein
MFLSFDDSAVSIREYGQMPPLAKTKRGSAAWRSP